MSIHFAFGNIDFGQDHTDADQFRSYVQVDVGPRDIARRRFSFPGVNAEFSRHLGIRGRSNRWLLDMVAKSADYLILFESQMEAAEQLEATMALTQRGIVYPRAYVQQFRQVGPRERIQLPWAWLQRYEITWRVLP